MNFKKAWDNIDSSQYHFILAVADSDCIENALHIKLFAMLVSLAGVGRRNLCY